MSEHILEDTKADIRTLDLLNTVKQEPNTGPHYNNTTGDDDGYGIGTLGSFPKEIAQTTVEIDNAEEEDDEEEETNQLNLLGSIKSEPESVDKDGCFYVKDEHQSSCTCEGDVGSFCKQEDYVYENKSSLSDGHVSVFQGTESGMASTSSGCERTPDRFKLEERLETGKILYKVNATVNIYSQLVFPLSVERTVRSSDQN